MNRHLLKIKISKLLLLLTFHYYGNFKNNAEERVAFDRRLLIINQRAMSGSCFLHVSRDIKLGSKKIVAAKLFPFLDYARCPKKYLHCLNGCCGVTMNAAVMFLKCFNRKDFKPRLKILFAWIG